MEYNPKVLDILDYPSAELRNRKQKILAEGKKLFDFGAGDPIEPTAEFIRDAVKRNVPEVSQYPTVKGVPALREAVKNYVQRRFGVALDPESEILPCTGSKEAMYNLAFLFIGPTTKKNILISPSPGYFVMDRSAHVAGGEVYSYELNEKNGFLMEISAIPEDILKKTAIAWINYPHNPTGVECDLDYLKRQVATCKKYDILLASDECYVDTYFGTTLPPSVLQVTKEGVLAFHSCSKRSGMTAYRTGFIAGDKDILAKYTAFRDTLGTATPIYTQHGAIAAWNDDSHPEERRKAFRAKRELFLEFFKKHGLSWTKTNSTLYFWVKTPGDVSAKEYSLKLAELGLVVAPGYFFSDKCQNFFRVALVPSVEDCKKALALWDTLF